MGPTEDAHVKLLARELLGLAGRSASFCMAGGRAVSRAEAVGVVVAWERREKLIRFLLDDGTGCIPCVLWLNHRLLAGRPPGATAAPRQSLATWRAAPGHASRAQMGALVRVRGRLTAFRGTLQLTVGGVVAERDPNAEALHWLQCLRLARRCHGRPTPPYPINRSATGNKRKTPSEDG
ncbi:unnamed protein product [Spirodela intermedia]|uniref:CST complex subunit STN1 n=1 Tax=Spirodela intermedia TaxID=51605 RepID=A0A7I8IHQ6_SPIIN|nr:unnamed protein product [Spirodela intermedia]CAA6656613.1 unnamed protein product [Spirodela intermedia]